MSNQRLQNIALGLAGLSALGIGASILAAPQGFYAGYGIQLGAATDLLSELRAPAANLAALGVIMLAGILRAAWRPVSVAVALTVFLAFPFGRIVGIALDGLPSTNVLAALAIEIFIGVLCLVAFRRAPASAASRPPLPGVPG